MCFLAHRVCSSFLYSETLGTAAFGWFTGAMEECTALDALKERKIKLFTASCCGSLLTYLVVLFKVKRIDDLVVMAHFTDETFLGTKLKRKRHNINPSITAGRENGEYTLNNLQDIA